MIKVENLRKTFGGFDAVDGASLEIEKGSITGLIGPNGAGKTTLFNVVAGVLGPTSGRVTMDGEDITGLPPHELFHKGLLRTFQIAHEFSSMSCRENLMMVPAGQSGETLVNTWFGRKRIADEERALRAKADEVLEFLTISHLADHKAGQVSGGQKKLLELGRICMAEGKVLAEGTLDEIKANEQVIEAYLGTGLKNKKSPDATASA
ncbi:MAG: ABC transporter ATP-binding protein [Rhodobacteraceae bacterium]|nr:ABC transporter ATP-binding protein [Paracoccaceae bacterium]